MIGCTANMKKKNLTPYEHFGQHGPADYTGCIKITRQATVKEAAPLLAELRQIGYKLQVVKRATPAMVTRRSSREGLIA